ncbi:MAG: signal peptide peptidase SppA [Paludibacteraceae bacterium]|nr:signal peptide peptidase SppA [Paludibacteraceae bacterium]
MLIYLLVSVILGALVGDKWLATQETKLESETVYQLQMEGTVVEQAAEPNPLDVLMNMTGGISDQTVGLDELIGNIRLAKTDDRIKGILLSGGSFNMGMASAKALRDELIAFKSSGKFLVAYAEHYGELNYYVASVADRIYINPVGSLDWHGLAAVKLYYPRLMDKLGIKMNILKVGTFKSAVEPYFCTKMSDADKMQTLHFLNGAWSVICNAVGESRELTVQQLNNYADETMDWMTADDYITRGLVDEKAYRYHDMDSVLRDLTGVEDYHLLSTNQMSLVKRPNNKAENQIAVLYAEGEITDEEGDGIVGTKMIKNIKKIAKNKDIKAVVLRVNSPGGSANASEQIWHALQTVRQEGKPVVVSMGDYAASGGYYISCGADYIYAEPTTLTGSIGIFGLIPDVSKLRDKIGIDIDGVGTNRHSDSHMVLKGMNDEEKRMMQATVEQGYELFTSRCAEGRRLPQDTVKAIGEGRVWLGTDALAKGLVDSLGNMDDAVNKAAELANIEHYTMAYYPQRVDFMQELLNELDNTSEEDKIIMKMKTRFAKPRIMALMPEISIR